MAVKRIDKMYFIKYFLATFCNGIKIFCSICPIFMNYQLSTSQKRVVITYTGKKEGYKQLTKN